MGNILKIIIIDRGLRHVRRLTQELEKQGVEFFACQVETQEALVASLVGGKPDLVLTAGEGTATDGFVALEAVRQHYPDAPFIFVRQTYSPGFIVEIFENGGNGLIPSNRLSQLREVINQAQPRNPESRQDVPDEDPPQRPELSPADPTATPPTKPICPRCKRICDLDGDWQAVEIHLRLYREATVKLGTCPDCSEALASF